MGGFRLPAAMEFPVPGGGWRQLIGNAFLTLALIAGLAACGPLPRPFQSDKANELVTDQKALAPISIAPIAGQPGLAAALTRALDEQEIAATTSGEGHFSSLTGHIGGDEGKPVLVWQLADGDGHVFGEVRQPLEGDVRMLAAAAAQQIADFLRGIDSGATDLANGPHVFFQGLSAPRDIDGQSLARAMGRALTGEGMIIDTKSPTYLISGHMRVTPAAEGQDVVALEWVVKTSDGQEMGRVNQASPVPRGRLLGPLTALAREIAEAGASGVAQVIRQKQGVPPPGK